MPTIEKCSEYNARITKTPDFKAKTHGYNFSYPVMNTIDICNLFISGGETEVSMNGQAKSRWSFDIETSTLTISLKNKEQKYIIDNPEELGEAMIDYFEKNQSEIMQKTLETNMKKSNAKEGNKNAQKSKEVNCNSVHTSQNFCTLDEFDGTDEEYFAWIKKEGLLDKLTPEDKEYGLESGYW